MLATLVPLAPFTIDVTSAVLDEYSTVLAKNDGWAVRLDLLVTNRDSRSLAVRPDIGIDAADAECQVGAINHENWNDPAWERLPQSTLLRAGASARMKARAARGRAVNVSSEKLAAHSVAPRPIPA
jgi:hypothetical protein